MQIKTVLITGAAGFIGSSFANWLIENTDWKIVCVDDLSGGNVDNLPDSERIVNCTIDINDEHLNNIYKIYSPEITYHFAAYASEGRSNYIRSFIHQNNTVGTSNVINACINYNSKLIFSSSVAVYSGIPPFHEETIPNPIDEYGLSKLTSEKSIQIAGEQQGLDWVIVRPRNVYGERQNLFDPSRNLMGIFCYNALNNLPLLIFGDGNNKRSFTYIDDILNPLFRCKDYSKQIINLGSSVSYSINEAAQIFGEVTGYKNIIHSEPRHEVKDATCKVNKSQCLLAYEDKTTLKEGIKKMWEWAKKQKMRPLQTPPKLELYKTNHYSIK